MPKTSTSTATQRGPLALTDVTITDDFWAPRRRIVRERTLPQQERQLRAAGQQFDALRLTWRPGDDNEPHIFWESDVAKWIEAASYVLEKHPDADLEASVDEAIALLAGAQQPDGYLNTYFTVVRPGERFTDLRDTHELYCLGHLIEAAVAHAQATGKTTLLDIVTRYVDLVDRAFGPGGIAEGGYDGHQEIELALIKLGRFTNERRYIDLAKRLIDNRGQQPHYFDLEQDRRGNAGYFGWLFHDRAQRAEHYREYNQSHKPVREQREAVGHSVRAMYMYSAMADLAAEYDDADLLEACEALWSSVTTKKMYLTGGIGSDHTIEGFGEDYDLPDAHGYAETCAAIGLIMWAQRMASITGEGKYIDVLERALYNGALSGASADGTCYFYGNPLASNGSVHRHEWFGVACCPPNLARLMSSLERYIYAQDDNTAVVNLYVAGSATFALTAGTIRLDQRTEYPWAGTTTLTVTDAPDQPFTISIRIPGWAGTAPVLINGSPVDVPVSDGYVTVERHWTSGDTLTLDLPMDARRVWANAEVFAASGKVAVERGPIVYCAEGVDHTVSAARLALPRSAAVTAEHTNELDVVALRAEGEYFVDQAAGLYLSEPSSAASCSIRLVPYFYWANRGQSTMAVWLRES